MASRDAHGQLCELTAVTGRRHGDVAEVEIEVEVGIFDPIRVIESERDFDQPPTERRHQMKSGLDERTDLVVADRMR